MVEKRPRTIENEVVCERIAKVLCNKNIIYSPDISQDKNTIYAKNYFWILHEIGHYIACDEQYKDEVNLGLRVLTNDAVEPNSERELSEEYCAVVIANHLYFNYINDDINEYKIRMHLLFDQTTFQMDSERYKKYNIDKKELYQKCQEDIVKIDKSLQHNGINLIS